MPAAKVKEFLDRNGVKYTSILHSVAYTMQEVASLAHIPGGEVAKTVMVFVDDRLAMAVVPASKHVSLALLKDAARGATVTLASESEFRGAFPDCELGAMPPFGNLYSMKVYVDESLNRIRAHWESLNIADPPSAKPRQLHNANAASHASHGRKAPPARRMCLRERESTGWRGCYVRTDIFLCPHVRSTFSL